MWILTGILLGSIVTSTHDTQELCEGRKVMLSKINEVSSLDCRSNNPTLNGATNLGTTRFSTALSIDRKCANSW